MTARLGIRELVAAGARGVGRYTGTLLAVFVVQTIVAAACMVAVAVVLANAFAHLPMWDDAVDGDLLALVWCARHAKAALLASGGIVVGALLLWQLASWFLVGGLYGVLAQRPEGRADTARCFGASGAATYLAYARLALCSVVGWLAVLWLLITGLGLVDARLHYALTLPDLAIALALGVGPALLLLHIATTIVDYARVELAIRGEPRPGAVIAYLRAAAFVVRRPLALLHGGLGWLAFAAITVAYVYFATGHPMYGAEGAVTLFVIRQGVALARTAIRVGVLAGQVELGKLRPAPPVRVEVKK